MISHWQEYVLRLWIRIIAGYSQRNAPLVMTLRTGSMEIVRTEQKGQADCTWCGRQAAVHTQVTGADLPYDIDVWHCRKHAPDWREYL